MELAICLRDVPVADVVHTARLAEQHGLRELWLPDGAHGGLRTPDGRRTGRDAFVALAAAASVTRELRCGVGVAAAPMYQPSALALLAATLAELSDGRFSLGLGVSHPELTEQHGVAFPSRPIEFMRELTRELRRSSAAELAFGGGWPVLLAALGPRMVALAGDEADGAVLNWLSPEHAARTVTALRSTGRTDGVTPRAVLYLRLCVPDIARRDALAYLGLGNYARHLGAQGLTDADAVAAATTLPADDVAAVCARLSEYRAAGIDLACIYPIGLAPPERDRLLAAIAAAWPPATTSTSRKEPPA